MAGNAGNPGFGGSSKAGVDLAAHMADFDALPAPLRAAIREAVFDWPTTPFLQRVRSGMSAEGAAAYIRDFEREKVAARAPR